MGSRNYDPSDIEAAACEVDPSLAAGGAFALETEAGDAVVLVHEVTREAARDIDVNLVAGKVTEAVSRGFGLNLYDLVLLRPGALSPGCAIRLPGRFRSLCSWRIFTGMRPIH